MKFNVNKNVRVRLTKHGLTILKRDHDELRALYPSLRKWQPPVTDSDGYSKHQLWMLMKNFGPHISMACEMPFDTDIIIGGTE